MKVKLKSIELYENSFNLYTGDREHPIQTTIGIDGSFVLTGDSVGCVSFESEDVDLGILSNKAKQKIENMYKDIEAIIQEDLTDRIDV